MAQVGPGQFRPRTAGGDADVASAKRIFSRFHFRFLGKGARRTPSTHDRVPRCQSDVADYPPVAWPASDKTEPATVVQPGTADPASAFVKRYSMGASGAHPEVIPATHRGVVPRSVTADAYSGLGAGSNANASGAGTQDILLPETLTLPLPETLGMPRVDVQGGKGEEGLGEGLPGAEPSGSQAGSQTGSQAGARGLKRTSSLLKGLSRLQLLGHRSKSQKDQNLGAEAAEASVSIAASGTERKREEGSTGAVASMDGDHNSDVGDATVEDRATPEVGAVATVVDSGTGGGTLADTEANAHGQVVMDLVAPVKLQPGYAAVASGAAAAATRQLSCEPVEMDGRGLAPACEVVDAGELEASDVASGPPPSALDASLAGKQPTDASGSSHVSGVGFQETGRVEALNGSTLMNSTAPRATVQSTAEVIDGTGATVLSDSNAAVAPDADFADVSVSLLSAEGSAPGAARSPVAVAPVAAATVASVGSASALAVSAAPVSHTAASEASQKAAGHGASSQDRTAPLETGGEGVLGEVLSGEGGAGEPAARGTPPRAEVLGLSAPKEASPEGAPSLAGMESPSPIISLTSTTDSTPSPLILSQASSQKVPASSPGKARRDLGHAMEEATAFRETFEKAVTPTSSSEAVPVAGDGDVEGAEEEETDIASLSVSELTTESVNEDGSMPPPALGGADRDTGLATFWAASAKQEPGKHVRTNSASTTPRKSKNNIFMRAAAAVSRVAKKKFSTRRDATGVATSRADPAHASLDPQFPADPESMPKPGGVAPSPEPQALGLSKEGTAALPGALGTVSSAMEAPPGAEEGSQEGGHRGVPEEDKAVSTSLFRAATGEGASPVMINAFFQGRPGLDKERASLAEGAKGAEAAAQGATIAAEAQGRNTGTAAVAARGTAAGAATETAAGPATGAAAALLGLAAASGDTQPAGAEHGNQEPGGISERASPADLRGKGSPSITTKEKAGIARAALPPGLGALGAGERDADSAAASGGLTPVTPHVEREEEAGGFQGAKSSGLAGVDLPLKEKVPAPEPVSAEQVSAETSQAVQEPPGDSRSVLGVDLAAHGEASSGPGLSGPVALAAGAAAAVAAGAGLAAAYGSSGASQEGSALSRNPDQVAAMGGILLVVAFVFSMAAAYLFGRSQGRAQSSRRRNA